MVEPATQGPFRAEGDQTSPTRPGAHPDGCTAAPPEILRRVPAAVAARRPALPCLEGPASCRESRRGSALHVAPPGVRRRMPPQPSRSPRRRCPQGCCRRRRGRWARTRPAARNWVSKSSQGRRACGGQESVQSGGPYRRAGRGGSSPPPSPVNMSTGVGDSPTLPELGSLVTIGSFSVASPSLLRQRINGWGNGRRNSRDGEASPRKSSDHDSKIRGCPVRDTTFTPLCWAFLVPQ